MAFAQASGRRCRAFLCPKAPFHPAPSCCVLLTAEVTTKNSFGLPSAYMERQCRFFRTHRRTAVRLLSAFSPSATIPVTPLVSPPFLSGFDLNANNTLLSLRPIAYGAARKETAALISTELLWNDFRKTRWRMFAKIVKSIRIPFLMLSVYWLGHEQGIIDYSRNPKKQEEDLLSVILAGVGCVDLDKAHILKEGEWSTTAANLLSEGTKEERQLQNVATVGSNIVKIAKNYVEQELQSALANCASKLAPEIAADEKKCEEALEADDEVIKWTEALRRMEGNWSYILIESPVANAFVSEILPQRIFVTTSMYEAFIANDDEMALVLGHEVSHLILGHCTERNTLETMLRTIEVVLLSIDPTEGALSLCVMAGLAAMRTAVGAAQSRENEREADELGIKLAAMACYDTKRASTVFHKMHVFDTEYGAVAASKEAGGSLRSFLDTHPPSLERYTHLWKTADEETWTKYEDSTCASIQSRLLRMLFNKKKDTPDDVSARKEEGRQRLTSSPALTG